MRPKIAIVLAGIVLIGSLAFASGGQESSTATESAEPQVLTGDLVMWHGSSHKGIELAMEKFEEENPGVTIELQPVAWKEYARKIIAAAQTRQLPDLLMLQPGQGPTWGEFEWILPLDDIYAQLQAEGIARYPEPLLDFNRNKGKLYGFPYWSIPHILFYRTDLASDVGIGAAPGSWEDFGEMASALTSGETYGYAGHTQDLAGHMLKQWLASNGADSLGADHEVIINSQQTVEALTFLELLWDSGFMTPATTSSDMGDARLQYMNSQGAMISSSTSFMNMLVKEPSMLEATATSLLPKRAGDRSYIAYQSMGITRDAENKELAIKALKYFQHPDTFSTVFSMDTGRIPANLIFVESGAYGKLPNIGPHEEMLGTGVKAGAEGWVPGFAHGATPYPALFHARQIYKDMILKLYVEDASPKEIAEWAEKTMEEIIADSK
jgi:multiple sugar transport system substrate-binding protein